MSARIKLIDVDRPREPLEVDVVETNAHKMRVAVPRTVMEFELRRSHDGGAFEGAIGGRYFRFDPSASATRDRTTATTKARKVTAE
jgi:hypothetical protein